MGKIDDTLAQCFIARNCVSLGNSVIFTDNYKVVLYLYRIDIITAIFGENGVIRGCYINLSESTSRLTLRRINAVLALLYQERYFKHQWKVYVYNGDVYLSSTGKSLRRGGIQIGPNKIDIIPLDVERSVERSKNSSAESIHTLSAEAMLMALV